MRSPLLLPPQLLSSTYIISHSTSRLGVTIKIFRSDPPSPLRSSCILPIVNAQLLQHHLLQPDAASGNRTCSGKRPSSANITYRPYCRVVDKSIGGYMGSDKDIAPSVVVSNQSMLHRRCRKEPSPKYVKLFFLGPVMLGLKSRPCLQCTCDRAITSDSLCLGVLPRVFPWPWERGSNRGACI